MKNLFILIFSTFFIDACGQTREVIFTSKFQPNKEYLTEMETISKSEIHFTGSQEKINNIKASGIELPMIIEGSTSMTSTLITYELKADSTIKARMYYDKVSTVQVQNGKRIEKESPISGMIIEGMYNAQNKFKIDTLISDKVDDNTRNTLIYTLENIQEKLSFPDYPLKVGDTFNQELPMKIPVAGISNVGIIVKTNYKLMDISENLATFNIEQAIELDMEVNQVNVFASGNGTGITQFDIINQFITKYESDLSIELHLEVAELKVNAKTNTKSSQQVKIK